MIVLGSFHLLDSMGKLRGEMIQMQGMHIASFSGLAEKRIKNNKIKIPDNVFFIGTINEDDSVSPISDKIFDRAQVIEFMQLPSSETVGDLDKAPQEDREDKYTSFKSFNNRLRAPLWTPSIIDNSLGQ